MTVVQTIMIAIGTFVSLAALGAGVGWVLWKVAYRSARKERAHKRAEQS